jgi:hypothetical protein
MDQMPLAKIFLLGLPYPSGYCRTQQALGLFTFADAGRACQWRVFKIASVDVMLNYFLDI